MHRALYVLIPLLVSPVPAMAMSFGVTTQMSQGGNLDKDRYFIFDFLVLGKNCAVTAITLNNANCSKDSIGEGRGFWVKVEYESTWEGNNLKCDVRPLGGGRLEVAIVQKITDGEISHRAIVPDKGFGTPVDYTGSMSKFSSMLNRLESVNYVPLRLNSALSGGWENITLGCSRMTVPKIDKATSSKK